MQAADDLTGGSHPLGRPTNRPDATEPDAGTWEPVPGAGPYIQRNTVTGLWRNVRHAPPASAPTYPWFGIP